MNGRRDLVAFAAANVVLVVITFALSWLPVVTRLVDRPVTTAMLRFWLPVALAIAGLVAVGIAAHVSPERRRAFLIRHFAIYIVVPLAYLTLRLHPAVLRTELGVLYLWTAAFFAVHSSLAVWHEVGRRGDRTTGLAIAGIALTVYLFVAPYHQASMTPSADEPHYLIVTQSLIADRDLDLRNNYDERQYRAYHPRPLPDRHVIDVGSAQYPIRDIGLPILAIAPFALGGRLGVLVLQSVIAAAAAWQLFHLLRGLGIARTAAWLAVTLVALTHPVLTYTTQIYPDMAALLIVVGALRIVSDRQPLDVRRTVAASALLGLLPWLTVRTWPAVVGIGAVLVYCALRGPGTPGRRAMAALSAVVPGGVLVAGLMLYHWSLFGLPLPNAGYLLLREQQQVAGNVLLGASGMLFGRTFGLLSHAPIYLLGALGWWVLTRRARVAGPGGAALLAAGVLHFLFIASVEHWHGDWSPPSRNVILGLPLLAAAAAAGLEVAAVATVGATRALRTALLLLAVWWTGAVSLLLLSFPENMYNLPERIRESASSGRLWDFVSQRIGVDPGLVFPSVARVDDSTLAATAAWVAVVIVLGVVGILAQRNGIKAARTA